jgi:hypothetical protein
MKDIMLLTKEVIEVIVLLLLWDVIVAWIDVTVLETLLLVEAVGIDKGLP